MLSISTKMEYEEAAAWRDGGQAERIGTVLDRDSKWIKPRSRNRRRIRAAARLQ
jgi:hypothetical protein